MSASPNDLSESRRASKVTFSPISSDLLIVRIRKMSSEVKEEDIPKISSAFRPIRRNINSGDQNKNENYSRSTVTDEQKTASSSSQTAHKEQTDFTPCLKHAAQNLSRKASDIPTEKISLCNNCSKSMLSYIFLVQDFLDSLAKEISGNETSGCLQCARQEVRNSMAILDAKGGDSSNSESLTQKYSENKSGQSGTESKQRDVSNDRPPTKRTSRTKSHRQESKRNEDYQRNSVKNSVNPPPQGFANQQSRQVDFIYNVSPANIGQGVKIDNLQNMRNEKLIIQEESNSDHQVPNQQQSVSHQQMAFDNQVKDEIEREIRRHQDELVSHSSVNDQNPAISQQRNEQSVAETIFRAPMERMQPNYEAVVPVNPEIAAEPQNQNDANNNFPVHHSPTLFREDVDGIVSTLSNAEREIYDSARNRAGWESLTEPQERLGPTPGSVIASEAFVTFCRNNAEAIGCLVVGTSLLLCRTSRTLCVLVSDGVSTAFRGALSSVFQVVQYVRSLDSLGTTKLALLEQPELGITFDKLNIWRLVQFSKCVYLNPDTLVIQNCDELFSHEELSAVADIGWPDCFNSGVFVFSPSVHTFWQLVEFAEKQGSYDGGDQGLLNSYFNSWSSDIISNKLSFIYNLMANVSYTYTPAFRQFGRNVKIVQFHGSYKPWHVKFFTNSGQVSPSSLVHPTYMQFVHIWLNIFRISVLRLMSQEIQSYATSQETICAVETLKFFPLPSESESEFFLSPPSARVSLAENKLRKSTSLAISEAQRRKSAEFFRHTTSTEDPIPEASTSEPVETKDSESVDAPKSEVGPSDAQVKENLADSLSEADEVFKEMEAAKKEVKDELSCIFS